MNNLANTQAKNSIWKIINRVSLAASVYFIWRERNARIFKKETRTVVQVIQSINENVKLRLMSLKVKKPAQS